MTNTLNKIMHDGDEYLLPEGFTPDNAGTTDDVLTKTANGYEWSAPSGGDVSGPASSTDGHLAVFDGATGKIIKDGGAIPTGDVGVSTDTGTLLSAGVDLWLGTETDFSSISTPDTNTLYIQYKSDGGGRFTPGVNTVAYYPFDNDILDHSGNNKNFTGSGYSFANNMITTTSQLTGPIVTPENTTGDRTINMWIYRISGFYCFRSSNYGSEGHLIGYDGENGNRPGASLHISGWKRNRPSASELPVMGDVILMTWTKTGTTMKLYINGVLTSTNSSLGNSTWVSQLGITKSFLDVGTYGEIIVEDKIWTDQEISDYYDLTKSLYGIS